MLRTAFVPRPHAAHPGLPEHRTCQPRQRSHRLNRREVDRLLEAAAQPKAGARQRSPAARSSRIGAADTRYRTRGGAPRALPRVGPAPSFESLAQEVTRDVHPRSLLEELLRLKLAKLVASADTVITLTRRGLRAAWRPAPRMLGFLGANVGDHLQAAVANVLGRQPTHFEQAIVRRRLERSFVGASSPAVARALAPHDRRAGAAARKADRSGRGPARR